MGSEHYEAYSACFEMYGDNFEVDGNHVGVRGDQFEVDEDHCKVGGENFEARLPAVKLTVTSLK